MDLLSEVLRKIEHARCWIDDLLDDHKIMKMFESRPSNFMGSTSCSECSEPCRKDASKELLKDQMNRKMPVNNHKMPSKGVRMRGCGGVFSTTKDASLQKEQQTRDRKTRKNPRCLFQRWYLILRELWHRGVPRQQFLWLDLNALCSLFEERVRQYSLIEILKGFHTFLSEAHHQSKVMVSATGKDMRVETSQVSLRGELKHRKKADTNREQ